MVFYPGFRWYNNRLINQSKNQNRVCILRVQFHIRWKLSWCGLHPDEPVTTIVTPFIYWNWLYNGKSGTTDRGDLYPGWDRIDRWITSKYFTAGCLRWRGGLFNLYSKVAKSGPVLSLYKLFQVHNKNDFYHENLRYFSVILFFRRYW